MGPSSLRSSFFVSLKQVEKRLKLDSTSQQPGKAFPSSRPQEQNQNQLPLTDPNHSPVESLSLPIYLYSDQEPSADNHGRSSAVFEESSEPPRPFMSCSLQLSPIQDNSHRQSSQLQTKNVNEAIRSDTKEIELLTQVLGLSDVIGKEQKQWKRRKESVVGSGGVCGCDCDGGFHEKILGVKGHKCKNEVGRLEAWIKYFLERGGDEGEERSEDLKLVYLLLGISAIDGGGGDFGGLEFPSIIEEFLKFDPPTKCGTVKLMGRAAEWWRESARRVLERAFGASLKVVKESLEEYSSPDFKGDHNETEVIQRVNLPTTMTNGRHLVWLIERMIELQVADCAVKEWSEQGMFTTDLQRAFRVES